MLQFVFLILLFFSASIPCTESCTDGSVRLTNSSLSYGAVEVCSNGWGSICSDFWDNNDASVVCKQLGYSPYGAIGSVVSYVTSSAQSHSIIDLNCTGNETTILSCPHNGLASYACSINRDANVFCQSLNEVTQSDCMDGDVRLSGGTTQYEGRVEVCINEVWSTVCANSGWSSSSAKVACKQIGALTLGYSQGTVGSLGFTQGSGPVLLGYLSCSGDEANLLSCNKNYYQTVIVSSCQSHQYDAAVKCEAPCTNDTMRLNGGGVRHGRVEVCISEVWTTICSDYWDYEDASVACKQLGFSPYGAIPLTSYFTDYDWSYGILDPNCTGLESSILNCSYNAAIDSNTCTGYEDAGVICQSGTIQPVSCETGDIRLINGTTSNEGRLEVCVNRVWGTVCGVSWGSTDSKVACRQLGHQELGSVSGYGLYGQGSGPIVFGYMYCNGNEGILFDCNRNKPSVASGTCTSHSYDVGLRCEPKCESGSIRLVGGTSISNGRVEVCVDKAWGTICSDYWDNDDASVVCRQLGYSPYGAIGVPGSGSITNSVWPHHITDVNCTGNENNLLSCPSNGITGHNCPLAIISCQSIGTLKADCTEGEVRLVNGNTQYEGRVEICINRVWGTVCSRRDSIRPWRYSWDTLDSNVVCRQAGHMELGSVAYGTSSEFGQGSGPILMSLTHCSGQESHLINCSYSPLIPSYCSHTYDVGVKCEAPCANGTVRLYSDSGSYFRRYGRVQVCVNNVWGTICDHFWDEKDASVVCRMLGYSPYGASALKDTYTEGTWYIHINDLNCTGTESSLWDCPMNALSEYSCSHYDDAAVVCQFTDVEEFNCTTGEVRLADGTTEYEGRVEVCENGVWGSVCTRYSFNDGNAYTLCHELGYQGGIVLSNSHFGVSSNPIFIYELYCSAFQSNLSHCYQRKLPHDWWWWWYSGCNNYHELSIRCENTCVENKIELYSGPSSRHGNIRVCVNGSWVMVCGYGNTIIDNNLASVVCSSIGYSAYGAKSAINVWNNYNYPYQFYNVQCFGNESSLFDCQYNTTGSCPNVYNAAVSVFCILNDNYTPVNCTDGDIRLYDGSTPNQGILHVCSNGIWGTVCSNDYWNSIETDVACFQLGYYSYGNSFSRRTTNGLFPIIYSSFDCQGNEVTLLSCSSGLHSSIQYCTDNAIELSCEANCTSGDIRLVGGGYYYGRVEVCVEGIWGTVCRDSYWDNNDASVVCRQLGFSPYGSIAVTSSWNSEERGNTFLTGLNCNGTEDTIFACQVDANAPVCSSNWADANVVCPAHGVSTYSNCTDGDIRLIGGSTEYEGRVEVCFNKAWGTVHSPNYYGDYYNDYFAQTVCNALGFTSPGAMNMYVYNTRFGEGSGPILMFTYCSSSTNSLFDCTLQPQYIPDVSHEYDAGVRCEIPCENGDIRLVGGTDPLVGRVELCVNKTWGTICDDYWDDNDASVVCRQVGFSGQGAKARSNLFTEGLKSFHIIDLNCNGSEENVFNCSHNLVQQYSCSHEDDASVQCTAPNTTSNCTTGHVRLTGGQSQYVGLVEICYGGVWKSICPNGWDTSEAQVVCRQLGFTSIGADSINAGNGFGPLHSSYFSCAGSEATLLNCSYYTSSCGYSYHAGVKCESPCIEGAVRLEGDDRYKEFGRVEVCINETWGTICGNGWDNDDASVICRQLGYSPYGAIAKASYPVNSWLPFHLYSVNCSGNESTLLNCSYSTTGTCYNTQNAGAICQGLGVPYDNCTDYAVRLVDGATTREGKAQICLNRVWGAFCYQENYYSYGVDATIICRELGYNNGNGVAYFAESPSVDVLLVADMSCSQSATSIKQCSLTHYTKLSWCDARHTAAVRCHNCTEGSVRLIPYHSYSKDIGRVEVCVDGSVSMGGLHYDDNIPLHIVNLNCTGNEESIWDCPSSTQGQESCTVYSDVSVACHGFAVEYSDCANGQIRLSNETSKSEGRVELCYNHVWFGICADDYNDYYDIGTICNSTGHSKSAIEYSTNSFLDLPDLPLFPFEFYCSSIMGSLLNCSKGVLHCYSNTYSYYYKYLGVTCQDCLHGDIKLSNSGYSSIGRINVCVNGVWGTFCNTDFDDADASVVCAQLGFSRYGVLYTPDDYHYYYNGPIHFNLNCTGTESSIWECPFNNATKNCYYAAYIICQMNNATVDTSCTTGDVRLVGGPNEYEGRVELCYNQMWGIICDHEWDTNDANVVCKQLGHQMTGSTSVRGSYYGQGQAPFFMRFLYCSSSDSSLIACDRYFDTRIAIDCGVNNAASVVCLEACNDGDVRLSGSSVTYAGRVELCVERTWTTLCDQTWDFNDAAVTCRQLGYSSYGAIPTYYCYTEGQLSFGITNLGCTGSEKHIFNCSHSSPYLYNCKSHNDAGLICQETVHQSNCTDGEVRLVDGSGPHEGRVEVCINEAWGTVCSNGWTNTDANVVCKQLGYLPIGGRARSGSDHFGPGVGPILMASVDCTGNEESLIECRTRSCDVTTCSHYNDAGVTCERNCTDGEIRLGDDAVLRGRVEVCINNIWTTICASYWTDKEATVICSQLGYSHYGSVATYGVFIDYEWPIGIYDLNCTGDEAEVWECMYHTNGSMDGLDCSQGTDASVFCMSNNTQYVNCTNGDVRLVGGDVLNEGNVQICYNNAWGSVCDNQWDSSDSNVVCYQLGLQPFGSQSFTNNYFSVSDNPSFVIGALSCSGSEESLLDCSRHTTSGASINCQSYEVAGARCIGSCTHGSVRLQGTSSHLIGEVEVCIRGVWSTVCGEEWDDNDATVICRQLGFSPYGSIAANGSIRYSEYPMRLFGSQCQGNENSIMDCPIYQTQDGVSYEQCQQNKAGAICQTSQTPYSDCTTGDIRLVGGTTPIEGRVEVCINNVWGTVCDDGWTVEDSNVACKKAGYQAFGSVPNDMSSYGLSELPILLTKLQCTGREDSLLDCNKNLRHLPNCHNSRLAGVKCEELCTNGHIRIVGDTSSPPSYGRVDLCVSQTWGTVCDSSWTDTEASVVCRQQGFSPYGAIAVSHGPSTTSIPTNVDSLNCTGEENTLHICNITYGGLESICESNDAGVICQEASGVTYADCTTGAVRLAAPAGFPKTQGRVEVCVNRAWGSVCDDGWSTNDANVACDQLGYYPSGAVPRYGSYYGQSFKQVLVSDLQCTGSELRLLDCTRGTYSVKNCGQYNEAGVKCQGSFPVYASKTIGKVFGGELVLITGPDFKPEDTINCIFGDIVTEGYYISGEKCLCITPEQYNDGIVELIIRITRGPAVLTGRTKYRYIVPSMSDTMEDVQTTSSQTVFKTGETVNITWTPNHLTEDILSGESRVNVTMRLYNPNSDTWEADIPLRTSVPNTGIAEITIPDYEVLDQTSLRLALIKVSLSSAKENVPKLPSSTLGKISRFKLTFIIKIVVSDIFKRVACGIWQKTDGGVNNNRLPPCPCNLAQMNSDLDRYTKERPYQFYESKNFFRKTKAASCYRQSNVGSFSNSQQCCYDSDGQLLTGIGGGSAYSVYPNNWRSTIGHMLNDIGPFYLCCYGTHKSCKHYYDRRPNDNCAEWPRRPPPARFFGDPHMITLDGYKYTFNGHGEFTMIESVDDFLTVQARIVEPSFFVSNDSNTTLSGRGTVITAIAARHRESDTVQFEVIDDELIASVNGDIVEFKQLSEYQYQNLTVSNVGNNTLTATLTTGLTITVKERNGILSEVSVVLSDDYYDNTRGLLGQYNDDQDDDLLPKSVSSILSTNSSLQDIHTNFGLTWIIDDPSDSIFTYSQSGSWNTFYKPEYTPLFEAKFNDPELEEEALKLCGDDKLCLFDVAATGDLSIGEATKETGEDLDILEDILQPTVCDPPCANGACVGNNSCFCSEGYQGIACDQSVLYECEENICVNGGTCSLIAGDTVCSCLDGYTGINCEDLISSPTSSPSVTPVAPTSLSEILVITFAVITFIIGVIVFILVAIFCVQRMKRDVKNPPHSPPTKPLPLYDDPEPEAYELDWRSEGKRHI